MNWLWFIIIYCVGSIVVAFLLGYYINRMGK